MTTIEIEVSEQHLTILRDVHGDRMESSLATRIAAMAESAAEQLAQEERLWLAANPPSNLNASEYQALLNDRDALVLRRRQRLS